MQPVSKQRLGKHFRVNGDVSNNRVFSMGSVQSAYKRSECSDRVNIIMTYYCRQ
jgi:hypothetical protein